MSEDLIFKAIDEMTDDEDDLWVLATMTKLGRAKFKDLYREIAPYLIREYKLRKSIRSLISKGLIVRVRKGLYAVNMRAVLGRAIWLLEQEEMKTEAFT